MSQERFTPKFELGTKVYIVDVENREIYRGIIVLAVLEKIPYKDEYGNPYFEDTHSFAKPSFKERYHINCWIDGHKDWTAVRYEEEVFQTAEDAMSYLSKTILRKFEKSEGKQQ